MQMLQGTTSSTSKRLNHASISPQPLNLSWNLGSRLQCPRPAVAQLRGCVAMSAAATEAAVTSTARVENNAPTETARKVLFGTAPEVGDSRCNVGGGLYLY